MKGYFDAMVQSAGPYRYQSESGHVVAQLNSGVSRKTADQIVAILEDM